MILDRVEIGHTKLKNTSVSFPVLMIGAVHIRHSRRPACASVVFSLREAASAIMNAIAVRLCPGNERSREWIGSEERKLPREIADFLLHSGREQLQKCISRLNLPRRRDG